LDATHKGNLSRFINHSCDPNCYSRVVQIDSSKKLLIFASKFIEPGEEIVYDYKFPDEEQKIPCLCCSEKCRKWMN
jgi:SET domain-containing protein